LESQQFFLSRVIWNSQLVSRWSGLPIAVGLVIYIPILQGDPIFRIIRIIDGLLIFIGCAGIVISLMKKENLLIWIKIEEIDFDRRICLIN
jgi:hypothetical protein